MFAAVSVLAGPASAASGPAALDSADSRGTAGEDLKPGSNGFTEEKVRERLGRIGFSEVQGLRKDDHGIWHGKPMHAGHELPIRMDHRGNVAGE